MSKTTGFTIWLTGMHRSGKSTIAELLAAKLSAMGRHVELLDDIEYTSIMADEVEEEDPEKETAITRKDIQKQCNIQAQLTRRIGQAAMTLTRHDVIAVVAALSPIKDARDENRMKIGRYAEVYVDAPWEVLMKRENDFEVEYARITKTGLEEGRMQKALNNKSVMFGINVGFGSPDRPELEVNTNASTPDECCVAILKKLCELGYFTTSELEAMTGMKAKKYVRPSDEPMTPPKPRGPILLIPKNSPIRSELMKSPGKLPNDVKRALRENAQKIKAEQLALRQARMDALGPSKEALEAEKKEAEAKRKEAEAAKKKKEAEAAKKKKEAEAKKAAEAAKKKKEAEKKKAAEAKRKEAEAKKKKEAAAKKAAEAAKKKKEAEKKKAAEAKRKEAEAKKKKEAAAKKAADVAKKKKEAEKKKADTLKKKKAVGAKATAKVVPQKVAAKSKAPPPSKAAKSAKGKASTAKGASQKAKGAVQSKSVGKTATKATAKAVSKPASKATAKGTPKNATKTSAKSAATKSSAKKVASKAVKSAKAAATKAKTAAKKVKSAVQAKSAGKKSVTKKKGGK